MMEIVSKWRQLLKMMMYRWMSQSENADKKIESPMGVIMEMNDGKNRKCVC